WGEAVRAAADPRGDDLADTLDAAITDVDLDLRRPAWWQLVRVAHYVLALAALVGFVWLAVIGVQDWLGMTASNPPDLGAFPLPTLLLAAGVVGGLLLAALSGTLVRAGARHRRAQVAAQLTRVVGEVAERRVLDPVASVLDDHRVARQALVGTA